MTNEINEKELDAVNGGSFWSRNDYEKAEYRQAGVEAEYGLIFKDKFFLKSNSGRSYEITYEQANSVVDIFKACGKKVSYETLLDFESHPDKYVRR